VFYDVYSGFVITIIGLTLIGGVGLMILIGCVLLDRPFLGLAVVLLGLAFSIATAAGIDLFLQSFTAEEFWTGGTHKRHAMRTFMPFGLGMTVGMVASGLLVGWITKYDPEINS
jgi:uncharacterized membrane protein YdfJ with MMPL/SSD domain